jgi:PAS domain S-box-containing protein
VATVLIAEDNPDHRKVMAEVVHRLGHEVIVAEDGRAALLGATRQRPDLVLTDLDMPHLDGLQLCRAMGANPALAGIPVVLVTALSLDEQAGLTDGTGITVIQKPFGLDDLAGAITGQLADSGRPAARTRLPAGSADDHAFAETLLDNVDAGLAACDSDGRVIYYNQNLRDFFGPGSAGVRVSEWVQRFRLRHHDGRPLRNDELPIARALTGETVRRAGLLATDQRGRHHWLDLNARPVHDRHGSIIGAVVAVQDVTASYQAHIYEACKTAVLEALTDGADAAAARQAAVRVVGTCLQWPYVRLWLLDPVTDRLRADATYTAPGEQPLPIPDAFAHGEGLAGRCWQRGELTWVPDIHADESPVLSEVRAGSTFRAAGAVPVRAGEQVTGVMTYFSHNPQEPEPGLAVLLAGIADNIGAHLQQHRADELAHHLAAVTDEYVALAGHELRTPLTSITAYSELIADAPDLPADVREMVEVVERNSRHLRQLIDQLLELAGLDSGHLRIADDEVELATVVGEAVTRMREVAVARDIAITAEAPAELPVRGDAGRLRQVVVSLLDNAVKFSPEGSTVRVRLTEDDGAAVLTVTDSGIGLPAGRTADLFRRLHRGENARHTHRPGSGLGLALCCTIVSHHRGTILLTPNEGPGTTATVRLPQRT